MSLDCPSCGSEKIVKNGKIDNGKQNHKCRDCRRQFGQEPQNKIISQKGGASPHPRILSLVFFLTINTQA
jgi:transposase-like protein